MLDTPQPQHARSRTAPPRSRLSLGRHRQEHLQEQPPRPASLPNTHAAVLRLLGLACHSADTAKNNLQEQPPRPAFSKSAQTKPDGISVRESEVCAHPSKHARSRTAPPRSRLSLGRHRQEQPPRTTAKTSLFQVCPDRAGRNQRPGVRGLCTPQQTRTQPYCSSSVSLVTRQTPPRTTSKNNRQDQPFPSLPRQSRTESASGSPSVWTHPNRKHARSRTAPPRSRLSLGRHQANRQEQPPSFFQVCPDRAGRNQRPGVLVTHPNRKHQDCSSSVSACHSAEPPRAKTSLFQVRPDRAGRNQRPGVRVSVTYPNRKHARSRTAPPRSRLSLGRHRQEQPPRPAFSKSAQTKPDGISVRESECWTHPNRNTHAAVLLLLGLACHSADTAKNNLQDQPFPSPPRQSRTESASGSPRSVHTPANTHAAVLRLHATNRSTQVRAEAPEKQANAAFQRFAANTRKA